jgi:hypothetical protein
VVLAGIAVAAYMAATNSSNRTFARGTLSPAAAAACAGPVTRAVTTPDGLGGARALGRVLWLSPVFLGTDAPTQVWMNAWRSTTLPRVVLRGWRCSDGRLLHIWFPPPGRNYSESSAAIERQQQQHSVQEAARLKRGGGRLTAALRPRALSQGLPCNATPCALDGLFMFSSPGKWIVQVQNGSKIVGTAVFDLPG